MAIHRKPTCWCKAYPFPHKAGGGKCRRRKPMPRTKRRYALMQKRNARFKRGR